MGILAYTVNELDQTVEPAVIIPTISTTFTGEHQTNQVTQRTSNRVSVTESNAGRAIVESLS